MSNTNNDFQATIDALKTKYESRIENIRKTGAEKIKSINDDAPEPSDVEAVLNFTFDVKWRITSIKFDVPKFSMEREVIKFDIPEVRMELQEIKFDVPSTRMVNKCIAKVPYTKGLKIYSRCLYTKVPEVYMKRVSIKMDIPKFNSKRVEIKFDKPVVKMETTEIKLHLPQFFLKKVDVAIKEHEREIEMVANELTSEIAQVQAEMKIDIYNEVSTDISKMFDDIRNAIIEQRDSVSESYDLAISETKNAIKKLKENNATDEVAKLEAELNKMVKEYQSVLTDIDKSIEEITAEEILALQNLKI